MASKPRAFYKALRSRGASPKLARKMAVGNIYKTGKTHKQKVRAHTHSRFDASKTYNRKRSR